jgi:hypothetical protein
MAEGVTVIRRRKPAEATAAGAGAEGAGTRAGGMWGGVLDSWDDVRDSGRNALVALHAARQGKSAAAAGEQEMDWLMLASMAEFPGRGGVEGDHPKPSTLNPKPYTRNGTLSVCQTHQRLQVYHLSTR